MAPFAPAAIDEPHPAVSAALANGQRDPETDPLVAAWREEIRLLRELAK